MTSSLKAEWLKLVTTRSFPGLVGAAALLSAFIVFGLVAQGPPPWDLAPDQLGQLAGVSTISSGLFCLIVGLRGFTEEFRHGTIAHTAFSDPHRTRTAVAKAIIGGVSGLIVTAASLLLAGLALLGMTTLTGGTLDLGGAGGQVAAGLLGAGVLWGVLGVGLGAVIRQPVPAVVTALLWVLVFENTAGLFLGPVARYLPGQGAQVLARGDSADVAAAVGTMAAWTAALWLVGWLTLRRRDVIK